MSAERKAAVEAVLKVAEDLAEGRLDPEELNADCSKEMATLFGVAVGPGDAAWELQCRVARQVIALDGIPVDELAEWVAVLGARDGQPSWIERALADGVDSDDLQ